MRVQRPDLFSSRVVILLGMIAVSSSTASASSVAAAVATVDWTDFEIQISGDLALTVLQYQAGSGSRASVDLFGNPRVRAETSDDKELFQGIGPQDWTYTFSALAEHGDAGNVFGQASSANGFVSSSAEAVWLDPSLLGATGNENRAESMGHVSIFSYAISGTGSGTLSLSIPYTLEVSCSADTDDTASAFAQVIVSGYAFPPNFGTVDNPWIACDQTGAFTQAGIITASRDYTFVTSFPYVPGIIAVSAETHATAGTTLVAEPPTALLLVFAGLTSVAGIATKRAWRPRRAMD